VVPRRYEIRIEPDLGRARFTGEEIIEVGVREPVGEILVNAAQLRIQEASIGDGRGRTLAGATILDEATERARIRFPETLTPGVWRLTLSFAGVLNDRLQGFYRSTAGVPRGASTPGGTAPDAEAFLAVTQFQAADARRVFPCWDEPAFKAVFEVTLVVDEHLTALSNSAVVGERSIPGSGKKAVRFAPTIPMSTYLLAFVVGHLEASEPTVVDGVPLRVWCVPGRTHLGRFAQQVAAFALRFFREYYGTPYPGDKLDLIAVPDFESGAMENFGAVIFRETNLLADEQSATFGELRAVADQVAHEVAHMWFGDLVTMAWWNGLWLNEAFATFMQLLAVDAWRPAWDRWVTFGVARAAALEIDALRSTRSVEFDVRTPADAEAMFDVLTYQKGAAILRMVEQHLGPDVFRKGVQRYLARHRFANAETRDLWRALGEASRQPVGEVMDGWVFRPGYPLVGVRAEDGGKVLVFSQRRFTYSRDDGRESGLWRIPIHFRARLPDGVKRMRLLLSSPEARVELPAPAGWVVVNEASYGFYRTRYASDLLAELASDLFGRLSPIERFALVNDTWAGALGGLAPLAGYLDLTARLRSERDRNVWATLIESFTYLERVVADRDRPALAGLVRDRLGPTATALGWRPEPGESETQRELRADVLRALGTLGNDEATHAIAKELYGRYDSDPAAVHPSLVATLLAIRAHAGTEADYAEFLRRFETARTPQDAWRYLFSLSRFRDPHLVQRTLLLTTEGRVRSQDAPFLVRSLLLSVPARALAWRFVKENWDTMRRRFTLGGLATLCEGITALATPELEADVREFVSSRGITLRGKTLEQYLEKLRIAVAFGEREAANLSAYLSRFR
jgi:puromycin-sensitive aminopeptidase